MYDTCLRCAALLAPRAAAAIAVAACIFTHATSCSPAPARLFPAPLTGCLHSPYPNHLAPCSHILTWPGLPCLTCCPPYRPPLQVDATAALRTLDMGPSADRAKEAAAFRAFWGDKAELRRFQVRRTAAAAHACALLL